MLARVIESHGIATVQICLIREHAEKVKPPRALVVRFPYGVPLGRPNDPDFQHRVMRAAWDLLERPSGPVLEEFAEEIPGSGVAAPGRDMPTPVVDRSADVAFEVTTLRPYYRAFVESQGGRTMVGLTGVPADRFRGLVRLLEAYVRGDPDLPAWPGQFSRAQYLRLAADDLKAFYIEARLGQRPDSSGEELQDWLWTETALAGLLRRVRDAMLEHETPTEAALGNGVVRWTER
ncbi:MAG: hypothetical protein AB7K36_27375 [Chloroflexota bacterium]